MRSNAVRSTAISAGSTTSKTIFRTLSTCHGAAATSLAYPSVVGEDGNREPTVVGIRFAADVAARLESLGEVRQP